MIPAPPPQRDVRSTPAPDVAPVVAHLQRHLGPVAGGWAAYDDGRRAAFQVIQCGPIPATAGWTAVATLGVSRHRTRSPRTGREIRQELLILLPAGVPPGPFPSVLQQIAARVIRTGHALARGECVRVQPPGPFVADSQLTAFYATTPEYLPGAFAVCPGPDHDVEFCWLIPVAPAELAFVDRHGWAEFERQLVAQDPDLLDLARPALRIPDAGTSEATEPIRAR